MKTYLYSVYIFLSLAVLPVDAAAPSTQFLGPTGRYLSAHPLNKIKPHLKSIGIRKEHVVIMNHVIEEETLGFFGYHGARREFLIFQDIIRYGIEEILGIAIRPDFHFLRIPGHPDLNVESVREFLNNHAQGINDNLPLERLQLLAMNLALYSPYQEPWELSLHFFSQNTNVAKHSYEEILIPFFFMLGVDPSYIHQAFEIGETMLTTKSGVLLQFYDTSTYKLIDKQTYLAIKKGDRYFPNLPLSKILLDAYQTKFPQFRLVLNNRYTLNPQSSLSIRRYTLTPPEDFVAYQDAMRKYFQSLPFDASQRDHYKAQLLSLWDSSSDSSASPESSPRG